MAAVTAFAVGLSTVSDSMSDEAVHVSRHPQLEPDCSSCSRSSQCRSQKCWGGKCVASNKYRDLRRCGFREECAPCSSSGQCATMACIKYNDRKTCLVRGSRSSVRRCFGNKPTPRPTPPAPLPNCRPCSKSSQCKSRKCWGGKCVPNNHYRSLLKCGFKRECAPCRSGSQCATMHCGSQDGVKKCVFDNNDDSDDKCFGNDPEKENCSRCSKSSECKSDKCVGGKCVASTHYRDLLKCGFKKECAGCSSNHHCASLKCLHKDGKKKCVFNGNRASERKCFH